MAKHTQINFVGLALKGLRTAFLKNIPRRLLLNTNNLTIFAGFFVLFCFFFFYLDFLSWLFTIHKTAEEGESYLFNSPLPLHKHIDIRRTITAESSPLHIASSRIQLEPLVSERKSLTTKH